MLTIPDIQEARRALLKPLRCPHCGKRLNWHVPLLIATRNCPGCGWRVVAEPEGDGPPPFTAEQLDAACAAYRRAGWRASGVLVVAFLLFYGSLFASVRLEEAVEPMMPAGCLTIPLMILLPGFTAYRAFVVFRRAGRER